MDARSLRGGHSVVCFIEFVFRSFDCSLNTTYILAGVDLYNVEVVYNKDEYGNPLPPQGEQYYQDPYPVGPSRGEMMLEPNRNVETVLYSAPMGEYPR